MKKITTDKESAAQVAVWLERGDTIAVWQNCDLSSPRIGQLTFTPVKQDETPVSPHWQNGNKPIELITSMDRFHVVTWNEFTRVKIRRGPPCYGGVHRRDRDKLDKAMDAAGDGASWHACYDNMQYGSPWFEAVISTPTPANV